MTCADQLRGTHRQKKNTSVEVENRSMGTSHYHIRRWKGDTKLSIFISKIIPCIYSQVHAPKNELCVRGMLKDERVFSMHRSL